MGLQDQVHGMHWAQLVACGYSQVPGVDFSENYSSVMNNITLRILVIILIKFGPLIKIVNAKTALFYAKLEGEIYMECPLGMKNVIKMTASF